MNHMLLHLLIMTVWAAPPQAAKVSIIQYKNGSIHFKASKTSTIFSFDDDMGLRTIDIKMCNRSTIEKFWNHLSSTAEQVKPKKGISAKEMEKLPWVQVNEAKATVANFEPAFQELNKINVQAQVVILESKQLCRE